MSYIDYCKVQSHFTEFMIKRKCGSKIFSFKICISEYSHNTKILDNPWELIHLETYQTDPVDQLANQFIKKNLRYTEKRPRYEH